MIGSYFTQEYALESAALFNPSMVWHPDQSGVSAGASRFVLSLRATGEGHVSSITFRSGVIDAGSRIRMDEPTRFVAAPDQHLPVAGEVGRGASVGDRGELVGGRGQRGGDRKHRSGRISAPWTCHARCS